MVVTLQSIIDVIMKTYSSSVKRIFYKSSIWMLLLPALLLAACSGMSEQEKRMIGKYYIPVISDSKPLIELNADGSSVLREIHSSDITFSVSGQWHVVEDSLVIENDSSSITIEDGDPGLVGYISHRVAYPIKSFNESTLSLERQGGIVYDYHRRVE
jgi:hypothetical protein